MEQFSIDPCTSSEGTEGSVKNHMLEEFEQTQSLNKWTIPAIKAHTIYRRGMFDFIRAMIED